MPSDDLIDYSIKFWTPRYGREITRGEAHEILANLTGCFEILLEWDREAKEKGDRGRRGHCFGRPRRGVTRQSTRPRLASTAASSTQA